MAETLELPTKDDSLKVSESSGRRDGCFSHPYKIFAAVLAIPCIWLSIYSYNSEYTQMPDGDTMYPPQPARDPIYHVTDDVRAWFNEPFSFPSTLDTDFTMNPGNLCPRHIRLDYLIVVKSSTTNFRRRRFIRSTFGRTDLFGNLTQRTVFLVGSREDEDDVNAQKLKRESWAHNDMIQGPFIDSYRNLTLKGVMALKWMASHCRNVKVVVHIDDDVFFHIFRFVHHWLPLLSQQTKTFACLVFKKDQKVLERGGATWSVRDSEFKGLTRYPFDHCNGFLAMMTGDLIGPMYSAAKVNPMFWIDDIYLYGMLPHTIGGVNFKMVKTSWIEEEMARCIQEEKINCDIDVFYEVRKGGAGSYLMARSRFWPLMISSMTKEQKDAYQFNEFI